MTGVVTRVRDQLFDRNRWNYLKRSLINWLSGSRVKCPNCGGAPGPSLDRKLMVTRLVRCTGCQLQYRVPTDPGSFGDEYYQADYSQGFTTDCPSKKQLSKLMATKFRGTPKDFSNKIELLRLLAGRDCARILDFGASWGYGSWQFMRAGFDVQGIEPGRRRARYACEMLAVDVVDDVSKVNGPFDMVFSSHVLEHVPAPSQTIQQIHDWLRPGGILVAYTPNGSDAFRQRDARGFSNHWGMAHPNYLDEQFYQHAVRGWCYFITGTPVNLDFLRAWDRKTNVMTQLDSWELLVLAIRPNTVTELQD